MVPHEDLLRCQFSARNLGRPACALMFESVSFASSREVGRARSTLSFDGIRHGWKKGSIELAARDQGLRLPLIVRWRQKHRNCMQVLAELL